MKRSRLSNVLLVFAFVSFFLIGCTKVSSISPANGATNVSTDTKVMINFSDDIKASSVNTGSVNISENGKTVSGSYSVQGKTVTFTPAASLLEQTRYAVKVTDGVKNSGGSSSSSYSSSFTTGSNAPDIFGKWSGASYLLGSSSSEIKCVSAKAANGSFIIAWGQRIDSFNTGIFARIYTPGSGWSGTTQVDGNSTFMIGVADYVETGIDNAGNAFVVWTKGSLNLSANYYKKGSGWQGKNLIQGNGIMMPKSCMSPSGRLFVAWNSATSSTSNNYLTIKSFTPATGWSAAVNIESGNNDNGGYNFIAAESIAASANGDAFILWEEFNGKSWENYCSSFNGNVWGEPIRVDDETTGSIIDLPEVAINSKGSVILLLPQYAASVYVKQFSPETGLGNAVRLDNPSEITEDGGPFAHDVALCDDGTAVVDWVQTDGKRAFAIEGARFDGTKWLATETIDKTDTGNLTCPGIAIDSKGNAMLVYRQSDNGANNMVSKRFIPASGWTSKVIIDSGNVYNATDTVVSASANGSICAAWVQQVDSNSAHLNVVANIFTPSN